MPSCNRCRSRCRCTSEERRRRNRRTGAGDDEGTSCWCKALIVGGLCLVTGFGAGKIWSTSGALSGSRGQGVCSDQLSTFARSDDLNAKASVQEEKPKSVSVTESEAECSSDCSQMQSLSKPRLSCITPQEAKRFRQYLQTIKPGGELPCGCIVQSRISKCSCTSEKPNKPCDTDICKKLGSFYKQEMLNEKESSAQTLVRRGYNSDDEEMSKGKRFSRDDLEADSNRRSRSSPQSFERKVYDEEDDDRLEDKKKYREMAPPGERTSSKCYCPGSLSKRRNEYDYDDKSRVEDWNTTESEGEIYCPANMQTFQRQSERSLNKARPCRDDQTTNPMCKCQPKKYRKKSIHDQRSSQFICKNPICQKKSKSTKCNCDKKTRSNCQQPTIHNVGSFKRRGPFQPRYPCEK